MHNLDGRNGRHEQRIGPRCRTEPGYSAKSIHGLPQFDDMLSFCSRHTNNQHIVSKNRGEISKGIALCINATRHRYKFYINWPHGMRRCSNCDLRGPVGVVPGRSTASESDTCKVGKGAHEYYLLAPCRASSQRRDTINCV